MKHLIWLLPFLVLMSAAPTIAQPQNNGGAGVYGNPTASPRPLSGGKDLDISTVTTGGTPVVAVAAGHCLYGCWIGSYSSVAATICVRETGTASTSADGTTYCLASGQTYQVSPQIGPVSVNSSTAGAVFVGRAYYP